jgi:hypothetical protein
MIVQNGVLMLKGGTRFFWSSAVVLNQGSMDSPREWEVISCKARILVGIENIFLTVIMQYI